MSRDNILRILLAVLAAAAAAWLVTATEWADVEVEKPPRGEAATNRLYAAQSLLRALGATVERRQDLDALPPPGARLVLVSRHWDLFPERGRRLREWVEQGGHLVIPGSMADHEQLEDWLPFGEVTVPASAKKPAGPAPQAGPGKDRDCRELAEPESVPPTYADGRKLRICVPTHYASFVVDGGKPLLWSLGSPVGAEMVRAGVGRGSVTVVGPWRLLENRDVLRADNPLALAAALQARAGVQYWFVAEESREPLLTWLWHRAWPAVALALLALALFLWRGAIRFGPVARAAEHNRRSMTEQVGGTAHFLQRHGAAALHAAQVRALHETAARQLRNYGRLDLFQRAQAIAGATGVSGPALARALPPRARGPGELSADLELLETARRRLVPGSAGPSLSP